MERVLARHGFPKPDKPIIQRNQNQSAVGGSDITNPYQISFEVKRQQDVSVPAWWRQCTAAAEMAGEFPVLLWRRNNERWHVVMNGFVQLPGTNGPSCQSVRVEISWDEFLVWFERWVERVIS